MAAKKDDPKKIAALSAGIIVAVGFAGWNINNAINPPRAAQKPAPIPADAALTNVAGERQETAAAPDAPTATLPDQPATALGTEALPAPEAAPALVPVGRSTEAQLAFNVDPFIPFPDPDQKPAGPAAAPGTKLVVNPGGGRIYTGPQLPPVGPVAVHEIAPTEPEPTLLGTLLGERPSAVFGGEGGMRIVPVGGRLGGWKVLAVSHGRAVVKSAHATRRLAVSGTSGGEVRAAVPEPATVAVEPRPEMMAMMTTMTVALPEAAPPPLAAPVRIPEGTLPAPALVPVPGPEPSPAPETAPAPEAPPAPPAAPVSGS